MEYTWTVISTDPSTHTMVVQYEAEGISETLSMPMPVGTETLEQIVDMFIPQSTFERRLNSNAAVAVTVGTTGTVLKAVAAEAQSEPISSVGSLNEEYLRALIFQVLEEIEASKA